MIRGVTKTEGSITIFHLKENLSPKNVKAFIRRIHDLIETGRHFIVLDMSDVEDVSLMGLVGISSLFNKCRQLGGAFKIVGLTREVRISFRESNLINTVEVYDGILDAIKSFRSQNLLKSKNLSGSFYLHEQKAFVPWDRLPSSPYLN